MKHPLTLMIGIYLLLYSLVSSAQYAVTPLAPPPNFTFNDLWHLTVLRSTADNYQQFYISLRIFDGNNLLKIKSNTATLSLPTGSHYYNLSNITELQPFVTSFYDASLFQQAISSGGQFPPGTYNIVYTLFGKTADGEFVPLIEDASQATIENMWPPMLLSPPDGDTIDTQNPILTWTPAFSSNISSQITYTLKLVELFPGQNSYQAIQSNPVYFTQNNIPVTMLPYPSYAQVLDTSKVYAWQVYADVQGTAMGSTEIWTFRFRHPTPKKDPTVPNKVYFDMKHQAPFEVYYITDGFLYIKYEEEYATENSAELIFEVLDKNFFKKNTTPSLNILTNRGINRIKINQCNLNLGAVKQGDFYYFKITNKKGEKFTLKFFPQLDYTCQ